MRPSRVPKASKTTKNMVLACFGHLNNFSVEKNTFVFHGFGRSQSLLLQSHTETAKQHVLDVRVGQQAHDLPWQANRCLRYAMFEYIIPSNYSVFKKA